jgi:pyroglutamyl-peptidase
MFGLAANTPYVRIETRAQNAISRHPDAAGLVPPHDTIRIADPPRLRGEAPFARLVQASRATGVKTRLSADAGTYVCNYTYWRAIGLLRRHSGLRRAVFVHVPEPGGRDAPSLERLVRAAKAIVAAAAQDIPAH